jgi:uncharacterized protein YndB with AHSA1/START domain
MTKSFYIIIKAPIERVFDAVDKEENIKKWMGGLLKTEYKSLKDAENPVGTKFLHKISGLAEIEGEVIAYQKPVLLGVGQHYKNVSGTVFYHFKPLEDQSTEIKCDLEVFEGSAVKTLLVKSLFPLFETLIQRQLDGIKAIAENEDNN